MNNMKDTPRERFRKTLDISTGVSELLADSNASYIHWLEKELTAVTEQRNEWKAKFIQQNKDLGCEMMDPNGTIWDYAKKLQTELAAAREELADWHNAAEQVKAEYPDEVHCSCVAILRKQLKHVTEQRDQYKAALQSADNHNHEIATKLEIVTEQRDEAREEINSVRRTLSKNGEAVGNGEYNFTIIEIVENLIRSKHYFVRKSDSLERQRDKAREVAARWESSSDAMERAGAEQARRADENREWALKAIRERDEAREQRDGLAEALNRISEYQGVDDEDPQTMAIEALQSLNQH